MTKSKVLLQLDVDETSSSFDALVAIDAGAQHILSYAGVNRENVISLMHGALFTRGPADLKSTAVFVGGSDASRADEVARLACQTFFGPFRVSLMCDPNGSNTTAAAAVLCLERHLQLSQANLVVLGGSGPVGSRIARLAAGQGASVRICSRDGSRAEAVAQTIRKSLPQARLDACEYVAAADIPRICAGYDVLVAAGAAGTTFALNDWMQHVPGIRLAVDLNAVPPAGLPQIEPADSAELRCGILCYGAVGVGGLKMKIHKTCLKQLFETNDRVLNTETIFEIGRFMEGSLS